MTAAVGLYQRLGLPEPWNATMTKTPLIVYGGSGAVGAYAIKLAQLSNIQYVTREQKSQFKTFCSRSIRKRVTTDTCHE
jgi:NADPH:quinone reductase-like Zn-dependent oxidoreductase